MFRSLRRATNVRVRVSRPLSCQSKYAVGRTRTTLPSSGRVYHTAHRTLARKAAVADGKAAGKKTKKATVAFPDSDVALATSEASNISKSMTPKAPAEPLSGTDAGVPPAPDIFSSPDSAQEKPKRRGRKSKKQKEEEAAAAAAAAKSVVPDSDVAIAMSSAAAAQVTPTQPRDNLSGTAAGVPAAPEPTSIPAAPRRKRAPDSDVAIAHDIAAEKAQAIVDVPSRPLSGTAAGVPDAPSRFSSPSKQTRPRTPMVDSISNRTPNPTGDRKGHSLDSPKVIEKGVVVGVDVQYRIVDDTEDDGWLHVEPQSYLHGYEELWDGDPPIGALLEGKGVGFDIETRVKTPEYDKEEGFRLPMEFFTENGQRPYKGMQFQTSDQGRGMKGPNTVDNTVEYDVDDSEQDTFTVLEISKDKTEVLVSDAPSYYGREIEFHVTVVSLRPATSEELQASTSIDDESLERLMSDRNDPKNPVPYVDTEEDSEWQGLSELDDPDSKAAQKATAYTKQQMDNVLESGKSRRKSRFATEKDAPKEISDEKA